MGPISNLLPSLGSAELCEGQPVEAFVHILP